jgi:sarcosine oxidase subunit alpha
MALPLTLAGAWHKRGFAALARSFRFHRPRGAFCHRSWCQQCRTRLPDGRIVLACSIAADATNQHATPVLRDALRPIGALAERTPPWFYERQRLRGGWQQAFVRTVRRLSAAPSLPAMRMDVGPPRRPTATHSCATLVVGGGPAGVAAAEELARAGNDCILVQAGALGGSARALPNADVSPTTTTAAAALPFNAFERYLCVGLYDDPRRALCIGPAGNVLIAFDALVVATGAYDRLPTVPGNDTPGIVGLRAFERLAAQGALAADTRVGVYAHSTEAVRALEASERASLPIAFLAGPGDLPSATCMRLPNARLARIEGRERVTGIVFEDGTAARCDLLVAGFTQPSYELQAQNGCHVVLSGDPPVVRHAGVPHARMLIVGEAAGWADPHNLDAHTRAEVRAWVRADAANAATTHDAEFNVAVKPDPTPVPRSKIDDAAFVCLCEDVRAGDIRRALEEGYGDVELVKRHTGAGTGPCQGKLCHAALLTCIAAHGADVRIPTPRPLVRPVTIAQLAGADDVLEQTEIGD